MSVLSRTDFLTFASDNNVMRVWDLAEDVQSAQHAVQAGVTSMLYHSYNDLLFAGNASGEVTLWKGIKSDSSSRSIKDIYKLKLFNDSITSIWHHVDADVLVCCCGQHVSLTKQLFSAALDSLDEATRTLIRKNMHIQPNKSLDEQSVAELVNDLLRNKHHDMNPYDTFKKEWKSLELIMNSIREAFESKDYMMAKQALDANKKQIFERVQENRSEAERCLAESRIGIIDKYDAFLPNEKDEQLEFDLNYRKELEELKLKHARELEQLEKRHRVSRDKKNREKNRQLQKCARAYKNAKDCYDQDMRNIDLEARVQVRRLIEGMSVVDQDVIDPHVMLAPRYRLLCCADQQTQRVFKAIDLQSGQPVAIKSLPVSALINARPLKHPYLVPVLNTLMDGSFADGFVVMEDMKCNLNQYHEHFYSNREPLVAMHAQMLLQCLEYLHGVGFVHRDLRPGNILLTRSDVQPEPRLVHLGIMKNVTGVEKKESGNVFAAPELFAKQVSTCSDVWSMGCVMAWMLMPLEDRVLVAGNKVEDYIRQMMLLSRAPAENLWMHSTPRWTLMPGHYSNRANQRDRITIRVT
ncbi:hypothetical protein AKO1_014148 [Acrasis kona]|uniref:Protein kinase domain-containing protein n=1 Tax=Acrasis kona TaxID=1008807 RepID=A0AAW2Z0P9_9EUKA